MKNDQEEEMNRRNFIGKTLFAGAGLINLAAVTASAQKTANRPANNKAATPGRRMLRKLEVSAVGMGVQNMHRRYETTVPYRPEMINILRAAYDRGITFFDCAEAYGPWENERILGEAIQPFRNKVRITSKYGWNIDQQTGRRLPGLNSKPDHIKQVVQDRSNDCEQTALICSTNIVSIRQFLSRMSRVRSKTLWIRERCCTGDFLNRESRRSGGRTPRFR